MMKYDVETLKRAIDLREFAGQHTELRPKTKQEMTGPCPFCGTGDDRFNVQRDWWLCRYCTEGHRKDIFHYAAMRWNLDCKRDFPEIYERLGGAVNIITNVNSHISYTPPDNRTDDPPPAGWQNRAREVINTTIGHLWATEGQRALAYLRGRGLAEETVKHFQLGYNPQNQEIAGHWVCGGITIPHLYDSTLWGIKIRRPSNQTGKKYKGVSGSKQNLFNAGHLAEHRLAFCVEGEFDAMLAWQEFGDLAAVVTLGSATGTLGDRWLPCLLNIKRFYIATDNDQAGIEAKNRWLKLTGKRGHEAAIPDGHKDVTDYHRAGGDLRQWVNNFLPPTRWVFADVAASILDAPPDSWPWTLHRPDGTPQTFATPAELREAVAR